MRMLSTTQANIRKHAWRTPLPVVALLLALSTIVVAQGPRFWRTWKAINLPSGDHIGTLFDSPIWEIS